MVSFAELPAEILVQILRYANLQGDLASLRQCNTRLLQVVTLQSRQFLDDLCCQHQITSRAIDIFLAPRIPGGHGSPQAAIPSSLSTVALSFFLHRMNIVAPDMQQAVPHPNEVAVPRAPRNLEQLMLLAVFSRLLKSSSTFPYAKQGDTLAPAGGAAHSVSISLSEELVDWLENVLNLAELESIIAAINVCTTRLWRTISLSQPKDCMVASFGGLGGVFFDTDQAILVEHVIWKGPVWVSELLEMHSSAEMGTSWRLDDWIVTDGVWKGTQEEGARLAASGAVRLLRKARLQRLGGVTCMVN